MTSLGLTMDSHGNVIGDSGPIIAVADDPNNEASSTLYRKQKLTEVFKALERKGWKFTNYEER